MNPIVEVSVSQNPPWCVLRDCVCVLNRNNQNLKNKTKSYYCIITFQKYIIAVFRRAIYFLKKYITYTKDPFYVHCASRPYLKYWHERYKPIWYDTFFQKITDEYGLSVLKKYAGTADKQDYYFTWLENSSKSTLGSLNFQ